MDSLQLIWRGLNGRCPNCGQGRIFSRLFTLYPRCGHCAIPFENQPGDFTGALHISSTLVSGFAMVLGVLTMLLLKTSIIETALIDLPIVTLFGLAAHRLIKGVWTAFMVYTQALEARHSDFGG